MDLLPFEIISQILDAVDDIDVLHFGATCKRFRDISIHKLSAKQSFDESSKYLLDLAISRPELYNFILTTTHEYVEYGIVHASKKNIHLFVSVTDCLAKAIPRYIQNHLIRYSPYTDKDYPHLLNYDCNIEETKKVLEYTIFEYGEDFFGTLYASCPVFDGLPTPTFIDSIHIFDYFANQAYGMISDPISNRYFASVFNNNIEIRARFFKQMTFDNGLSKIEMTKNNYTCTMRVMGKSLILPHRRFINVLKDKIVVHALGRNGKVRKMVAQKRKRAQQYVRYIKMCLTFKDNSNFKITPQYENGGGKSV